MNILKKLHHRKAGERIIEDTLIKAELREDINTMQEEIDRLFNLKLVKKEKINSYKSNIGNEILFFISNKDGSTYYDCEIFHWGSWAFLKQRIQFELKAFSLGIVKRNYIKVK